MCLALLFTAEIVAISLWLDTASLAHRTGLTHIVGEWGADILRSVIGFAVIFFTFTFLKAGSVLLRSQGPAAEIPFGWSFLAAHCGALAVFAAISSVLFAGAAPTRWGDALAAAWLATGLTAIALAALAFLPASAWTQLLRSNGWLCLYAAAGAGLACVAGDAARLLWKPASYATFALARLFLRPLLPGILADPAKLVLGTPRFSVAIARQCSGLEGAALLLAFGIFWLVLFRRECRFPQALLLLPAAVTASFLLNTVRIAALVLIGNAGAPEIATRGFHSQAGWIFFNVIAVGFCLVVRQVRFFTATAGQNEKGTEVRGENPTAAYLLPLLAILAAGMVAGAAAGGFEWLYPLRFFAAAAVLWAYRRSYSRLDWRCSWLAPLAGAAVFALWIASDRLLHGGGAQAMPVALSLWPASARLSWIALRVAGSVLTVPIAEELAFRGFLMRRLVSADFESMAFQRVPWYALLVSSVAFGVLHGGMWAAGIVSGLLFALLVMWRGRLGDAVVAHATANALVAAYVLLVPRWGLW